MRRILAGRKIGQPLADLLRSAPGHYSNAQVDLGRSDAIDEAVLAWLRDPMEQQAVEPKKRACAGLASVLQLAHSSQTRLQRSMDAIAGAREDSSAAERAGVDSEHTGEAFASGIARPETHRFKRTAYDRCVIAASNCA